MIQVNIMAFHADPENHNNKNVIEESVILQNKPLQQCQCSVTLQYFYWNL